MVKTFRGLESNSLVPSPKQTNTIFERYAPRFHTKYHFIVAIYIMNTYFALFLPLLRKLLSDNGYVIYSCSFVAVSSWQEPWEAFGYNTYKVKNLSTGLNSSSLITFRLSCFILWKPELFRECRNAVLDAAGNSKTWQYPALELTYLQAKQEASSHFMVANEYTTFSIL